MLPSILANVRPAFVPMPADAQTAPTHGLRVLAFSGAVPKASLERLALLMAPQQLAAGETLIDEGEDATPLFTITSGSMKIYKLLSDGRRQITGFLFRDDFLSLAFCDHYTYSAEALTDTTVCRFPRHQFDRFVNTHPGMERRLLRMAANELAAAQEQMVLLGRKMAPERVASFLLSLIRRQEHLSHDGTAIRLTMTRAHIADYLVLTTETVSRAFTGFRSAGYIELDGAALVRIRDREELDEIAEAAG